MRYFPRKNPRNVQKFTRIWVCEVLNKCYVKMFIFPQERWSIQHWNSAPNGSLILSAEIYLPLSDGKRDVRQRRVRIFWWRGPQQWKLCYWETPTGDWKCKEPAPDVLLLFPAAYWVNKMCLLVWFNLLVLLFFRTNCFKYFFPTLLVLVIGLQFTLFFPSYFYLNISAENLKVKKVHSLSFFFIISYLNI